MNTKETKPTIVQQFDYYVDREYSKITHGFWGKSSTVVRADRLKDWTVLNMECSQLPDEVIVNGEEYKLVKL